MCVHYNLRVKLLWAILLRQVWQLNFGKKKFLKRYWKKSQVVSRESCFIMVWSLLLTIDIFFISSSKSHKSTRKFILCWKIHTCQIKTSNCNSNLLFIPHKYCTKTITAVNLSITLISDPKLRELIWCAMSGLSGCERHNRNHFIKLLQSGYKAVSFTALVWSHQAPCSFPWLGREHAVYKLTRI